MPSSRQAHITRRAISPRLATRTLLNIRALALLADPEQRLAVLHRLPVLAMDRDDFARHLGLDLVHELHGLDDAQHLPDPHAVAHVHERRRRWVGPAIES